MLLCLQRSAQSEGESELIKTVLNQLFRVMLKGLNCQKSFISIKQKEAVI